MPAVNVTVNVNVEHPINVNTDVKGGDVARDGVIVKPKTKQEAAEQLIQYLKQATNQSCVNELLAKLIQTAISCNFDVGCIAAEVPTLVLQFVQCQFGLIPEEWYNKLVDCLRQHKEQIAAVIGEFAECALNEVTNGRSPARCFLILLKLLSVAPSFLSCLFAGTNAEAVVQGLSKDKLVDCLVKAFFCLIQGGDVLGCVLGVVRCLLGGDNTPPPPPPPAPPSEGRVEGPVGRC